jgi:nucleotidyltransferase/DNA polymerase involved in DNA repair
MAYPIESLGPVGTVFADRLREAGIASTDDLLARAGDGAARRALAAATGIDEALLRRWAERCDLYRIHGLGRAMADLLGAAGLRTISDVAAREPGALSGELAALNAGGAYCAVTPDARVVEGWILRARALPPRLDPAA